jgi:hypothetical protein
LQYQGKEKRPEPTKAGEPIKEEEKEKEKEKKEKEKEKEK